MCRMGSQVIYRLRLCGTRRRFVENYVLVLLTHLQEAAIENIVYNVFFNLQKSNRLIFLMSKSSKPCIEKDFRKIQRSMSLQYNRCSMHRRKARVHFFMAPYFCHIWLLKR